MLNLLLILIYFFVFLPVCRSCLPTYAQPYCGIGTLTFQDLARGLTLYPVYHSHRVPPLGYGSRHSLRASALVPPVTLFGGRRLACGKKRSPGFTWYVVFVCIFRPMSPNVSEAFRQCISDVMRAAPHFFYSDSKSI